MNRTKTGRWSCILTDEHLAGMLGLLLLIIGAVGCNAAPALNEMPGVLPQRPEVPEQSTPARSYNTPDWMKLELLPGCTFGSLSQDSQWLVYSCPFDDDKPRWTLWLAQVNSGQLNEIKGFDLMGGLGFLPDNSGLLIGEEKWWLVDLPDLTQQEYISHTQGAVSGIWSPNGKLAAVCAIGCQEIFVFTLATKSLEKIIDGSGRHATKISWSPDSHHIAYIAMKFANDNEYKYTMSLQVFDLSSRQSSSLFESSYQLTGASWSPLGNWIAIREEQESTTSIWLIDPQTGKSIELKYELGSIGIDDGRGDLIWSPDGSKLALRDSSGVLITDVSLGKTILRTTQYATPLGWSSDGKRLLMVHFDYNQKRDVLQWITVES